MKNKILILIMLFLPLRLLCQSDTIQMGGDITIYAPNAFTPDGKMGNNTWKVYTYGIDVDRFHLIIYNRYGVIIWESYDSSISWDGTYGGFNVVPTDIYVWRLITKSPSTDKMYEFTGFVTLLN